MDRLDEDADVETTVEELVTDGFTVEEPDADDMVSEGLGASEVDLDARVEEDWIAVVDFVDRTDLDEVVGVGVTSEKHF